MRVNTSAGNGATRVPTPHAVRRTANMRFACFLRQGGQAAATTHKKDSLCTQRQPAAQVSFVRIALLDSAWFVNVLCMRTRPTGHADHRRAADLGESRPDELPYT
jgi:hypothetical protein